MVLYEMPMHMREPDVVTATTTGDSGPVGTPRTYWGAAPLCHSASTLSDDPPAPTG